MRTLGLLLITDVIGVIVANIFIVIIIILMGWQIFWRSASQGEAQDMYEIHENYISKVELDESEKNDKGKDDLVGG